MEMICPKCRGAMRSYERNGVTVDQCGECRGIFLDRGELERLIDAEEAYHASAPSPPSPRAPAYGSPPSAESALPYGDGHRETRERAPAPRYDSDRDRSRSDDSYRQNSDDSYRQNSDDYYRKKRKRSFLEDLFD